MTEFEIYTEAATAAFHKYYENAYKIPPGHQDIDHVINIGRSVMMHRDGIIPGGGFVTRFCDNDLEGALCHADSVVAQHFDYFLHCKLHVYPETQNN